MWTIFCFGLSFVVWTVLWFGWSFGRAYPGVCVQGAGSARREGGFGGLRAEGVGLQCRDACSLCDKHV